MNSSRDAERKRPHIAILLDLLQRGIVRRGGTGSYPVGRFREGEVNQILRVIRLRGPEWCGDVNTFDIRDWVDRLENGEVTGKVRPVRSKGLIHESVTIRI